MGDAIVTTLVQAFHRAYAAGWEYHVACAPDGSNRCEGCQIQLDNLTGTLRNAVRKAIAVYPHVDTGPDKRLDGLVCTFALPEEAMVPERAHVCGDGIHLSIAAAQAITTRRAARWN
jgi:hypothetical protein